MKLKSSSLSASLYRYFYNTEDMPNSLCTYFWKLVIAYLLTIPLEIIAIPCTLFSWLYDLSKESPAVRAAASSILIFLFCLFLFLLIPIIQFFIPISRALVIDTLITDITLIVILIFYYFKECNFLVKDFIIAKAKKVCPKIDWE
jgi:hypothetical protein